MSTADDRTLDGEYVPNAWDWVAEHVARYESSGGLDGTMLHGFPTVVLTTRGARSGKIRKTPVIRVSDGERYAAVGSVGGAPKHPAWYHNVLAHPRVRLQDGPVVKEYEARVAEGEERAAWWARAVETFPQYAEYQRQTERVLPVVVLEVVAADA
ncbi:nitroreductase family deazaflavin-dependent oxidoreductase [Streptomyces spectabilis]|uniref:Deazaflavin-dependent oxidoreductase (Nitroreductase family) n=1 Tax=Streptomyces spectabilis TaxID=68270 RepID=A0A5P2X7I3_STRST|nr:nitroreductase family deazaflavin-dependent oxidoreductase [Streptomyces spectabilis]MBB5101672.1 deazaflavin-dependent oxidoreductase (nitroreductase family) [Streptomyces spectabilis]MCI3900854.1 nitroreductase family deazaflavin-dependent oxidoreductase [Streptomyces spectabilis]QEV58372.1 nitroreductase family deazaflavin-dependent oxidoreductase [Streptomyces spectabilis]GGV49560.1 nitroreductase [Streptomyces spectabilis]